MEHEHRIDEIDSELNRLLVTGAVLPVVLAVSALYVLFTMEVDILSEVGLMQSAFVLICFSAGVFLARRANEKVQLLAAELERIRESQNREVQ